VPAVPIAVTVRLQRLSFVPEGWMQGFGCSGRPEPIVLSTSRVAPGQG